MASGFQSDAGDPEQAIPVGGLSSRFAGNAVAFAFRRTTTGIIDYVQYMVRFWISTGGGPWSELESYSWQPTTADERLEAAFPLVDGGMETFSQFRVEVFSDPYMEDLLFTADSSVSQTRWTLRFQPIFERIFYMLERDSEIQYLLIRDLPLLSDPQRVDPQFLIYLAYLIGGGDKFPGTLSTFRQRAFVENLVNLWKIKGTFQSWRQMGRLRNLGTLNVRELWKNTLHEVKQYSPGQDGTHQLKSARIDVMSCDTQCESFSEFPLASGEEYSGTNITVSEAIHLIEDELNDLRPIHVLVRRLVTQSELSDEFPTTIDALLSTARGVFSDLFPAATDTVTITQSCESACQLACQLCDQQVFDPVPFSGGTWRAFNYTTGAVPPALAAYYAASVYGAGSVTGAAPAAYYTTGFDDSLYTDDATAFSVSNSFAAHSEIVLRRELFLTYVTGIVVVFEMKWVDFAEAYWNGTPISPLIMFGAAEALSFTPPQGHLLVEVPSSLIKIGTNFIAVRGAAIHGAILSTPFLDVEIRISIREAANEGLPQSGPFSVTF